MKRVLFFFIFLFALVGAAASLPFLLNAQLVSEQLQAAVKAGTGRTLTLASAPRFTYWPEFSVELEGAGLSNPPGMYEGQVATMDLLRARVAVLPLLSKRVEIKELTLVRPNFSLIVDNNGKANWAFESTASSSGDTSASQATPGGGMIESVSIAPLQIEDGRLRYLDERTGTVFSATNVNMTVSMPSLSSPITTKGSIVWNSEKIGLNIFVKSPPRLAGEGSPLDLAITSRLLSLTFNGRAAMTKGLSLAGSADIKSSSLRSLAKWAGNPLAPGKGLEVFYAKGSLDLSGDTIKLTKARFGLDGMNAQGNVTILLAGKRPSITANLGVDKIDANIYAAPATQGTSSQGAVNAGWSDQPIDMSGLSALDAKLNLAAAAIQYGDVAIGSTNVIASLQGGVLKADLKKMTFYDGKAEGKLVLDSTKAKPALQGSLSATGLDGYRLLTDFARIERISGVSGIHLSIAAAGASQRELVSTMHGTGKFKFNDGALRGLNIARMIRNVQKAILGGWDTGPEARTDFSLLEASFDIKDGIAKNTDLKLLGPLVRITGLGEVDLLRQVLDYRTSPKLVASLQGQGGDAGLTGIAVPIIIKGPWSNPKIYPDIEGILNNPKAAFKALAKLGKKIGDIDLDAKADELKKKARKLEKRALKKAQKEVTDKASKILGQEAGKALGDNAGKALDEGGASLLNNLLGGNQNAPAGSQ